MVVLSAMRGGRSPSPPPAAAVAVGCSSAASPSSSLLACSKRALEWVPLEKHQVFSSRISTAFPAPPSNTGGAANIGGLAAWDASSSRLYVWDREDRCLHRLSLRFCDPDYPASSSPAAAAVVEAASPSEILIPDVPSLSVIHQISLSVDGSSLLLSGYDSLALMYLYERTSSNDDAVTCRTVPIGSQIFSGLNNSLQILQVSWHPYSSSHLGILCSDSIFRLFDLSSDLEQPEQEFYLEPVEHGGFHNSISLFPVAFSFGGHHLWDRFSIFLLFNDGSIYVLCPVVPFGSLHSWAYIEEIYEDANMFRLRSSNAKAIKNSNLALSWLEATFSELVDRSVDGGNRLVSRAHPYAPLDASLSLQGPLVKLSSEENDDCQVQFADCEGKAVSLLYSCIGRDSILVIAWSSGQLQINALADEVQPLWNIGSSPHIRVDSNGHLKGVAMICEQNLQELSNAKHSYPPPNVSNTADTVWLGHPPPLLRLAIVDLALPRNALDDCPLALFSDPLISERFYCLHWGGIDCVVLHFLPFSNLISETDKIERSPSVYSILSTGHSESCSPTALCGLVIIADSYGHSQMVGISHTYECIVLEIKGYEVPPFHYDINLNSAVPTKTDIPEILSKELLSGPKVIVVPASTTLQSLTADSIEGRSTLHHYIKIFHENYVEYAHKVYVELEQHGDYLKMIIDDQHRRLHEAKQLLLSVEAKEASLKDRISRACKVYELLEQRLQNFRMIPGANKKPLSKEEREFKAQLDRFADLELDALHSSVEALQGRLRRCVQPPLVNTMKIATQGRRMRKNHVPNNQMQQIRSSLELLLSINNENTEKVKCIECKLNRQEQ